MHILGLANGSFNGNSEILLKAALTAAKEADSSITVSWVHLPSVSIPLNPKPLPGSLEAAFGANPAFAKDSAKGDVAAEKDDRQALLNSILDADALIFATPVYSHGPAGTLKAVLDRILGPYVDATFASKILERKKAGDPMAAHFPVDERVLKPRVAAFMAVGGSSTPDQVSLALPVLHLTVYPLHIKVVDQAIFQRAGSPGMVLVQNQGGYMDRAQELGRHVASQVGKKFDDAEYLGEESESACPYCHLDKIELFYKENKIGCIACGAEGHLEAGSDGIIRPRWNNPCGVSSITWAGKELHADEIFVSGAAETQAIRATPDFDEKRQFWRDVDVPKVALPSLQQP